MSAALDGAMAALEAALGAETAAIAAGDLRGAAALGQAKAGAIEAFMAARARLAPGDATALRSRIAAPLERLRAATAANRAALEGALALQGRVIEVIARAAVRSDAAALPGYAKAPRGAAGAYALSVRA